jgi:hypothetical protein
MKALLSLANRYLLFYAYGMDAPMGGLDAMADEDYAEEARILWMVMRLEQRLR